jgi:hypothetical protein
LLVFIHGFGSDSIRAWTASNGAYWPKLIEADPDLTTFAVATGRFGSTLIRRTVNIEQAANALGSAMEDAQIYRRFERVVFVTHSTGGVVLRRILNSMHFDRKTEALRRVGTVFFMAVPTSGAPVADLARWLSQNPQLRDLSPSEMGSFLLSVDRDWESLLSQRDTATGGRPLVFCGYEIQDTRIGPIVPSIYSRTQCDEPARPFDDRDHITLVKPLDREKDNVYSWVKARLLRPAQRAGSVSWKHQGERLGALVARLRRGYFENRIPEDVSFAPGAEGELAPLWIPAGNYVRDSWGDVLALVAQTHTCLGVQPDLVRAKVVLTRAGPVTACSEGADAWNVCAPRACTR